MDCLCGTAADSAIALGVAAQPAATAAAAAAAAIAAPAIADPIAPAALAAAAITIATAEPKAAPSAPHFPRGWKRQRLCQRLRRPAELYRQSGRREPGRCCHHHPGGERAYHGLNHPRGR